MIFNTRFNTFFLQIFEIQQVAMQWQSTNVLSTITTGNSFGLYILVYVAKEFQFKY